MPPFRDRRSHATLHLRSSMTIDRDATELDPIPVLERLIAIESVNPDLVPGAAGESAIATFCGDWLERHGFEVRHLESRPGRPSVVGVARGRGGGRSLLLLGHTDTVSIAGYEGDALAPARRD